MAKWIIILNLALCWILLSCRLSLAQAPPSIPPSLGSSTTTINTGQTHSETGELEIEKEHSEADPYKIHQEYMSEPWRQSSSYGILHRYCITLILINIFLFIINSLRKRERFKSAKISGKGVSNAEQ